MNKNDIKKQLFDHLTPLMCLENYKAEKGNDRFIQKTEFGFRALSYHIIQRSSHFELIFYGQVRFNVIEDIWHIVSRTEESFQKNSATIIIEMGNIPGVKDRTLNITNPETCTESLDVFFTRIYPLMRQEVFDVILKIEDVNRLLNSDPELPTVFLNNPEDRALKGIIASQIIGDEDATKILVEKYRMQLREMDESIRKRLEQIINR